MEFTYNPLLPVKGQGLDQGEGLDLATDDMEDIHTEVQYPETVLNTLPVQNNELI
jgi:hypothetical protein